MDEEGKLESNFLAIVLFHVVDGHEVFMEVASDKPSHEPISTLFKEILKDLWLLLMQWKMIQNNPLQDKVLKVNFLSENCHYCLNPLPAIKNIKQLLFAFFKRCFDDKV